MRNTCVIGIINYIIMIQDHTQHLGVLSVSVHIPDAQSLKAKRFVLKSLKDKVRQKYNVSVAELDGQDKWQVSTLGFAMINNDRRRIDSCLQNILSSLESFGGLVVCDHSIEFY
ncbi:MAG: DUF503 domain-containing protein [Candidatus Omnitrophica bacterium]|nr:DUF503 domain-containing protein [Candidatus Omnitrophota bacterium]